MTESVVLVERDARVAVLTLNRPASLNAFDEEMAMALWDALADVADDDAIRVVVLTGAEGKFSAGADLREGFPEGRRIEDVINRRFRPSLELIANMDKPVIAAIAGPAAGIGLSFAMACDLVAMSEDAYLLSPFATIGLVPDGGATWWLARHMGYHRAFEACAETQRIPAAECLRTGLANRVVPAAELRDNAVAWAASLAERAPLALAATKRALREAMTANWGEIVALEARLQNACLASEDSAEGVAAFLEKRKPEFKGR